jgi:hypothetical protein
MRSIGLSTLVLSLAQQVLSQGTQASLSSALANYTELSAFNGILGQFPQLLSAVLDGKQTGVTILIPTNNAFTKFIQDSAVTDISQLPLGQLQNIFKYHVMDARLKSQDFNAPRGLTVPTILKESQFNNRTAGPALQAMYGLEAIGQVLFVSKDPLSRAKFKIRQTTSSSAHLRAGLAQTASLKSVDGEWDGGYFQIVDT